MSYINALRTPEQQNQVAAFASGLHMADGSLFLAYSTGTGETLQIYTRSVLGLGEWTEIVGAYWKRLNLPETDYIFYPNGEDAPAAGSWFERDAAHPGFALADAKLIQGIGEAVTKDALPELPVFLVKTRKFPDFDIDGNQINQAGAIVSSIDEPLDKSAFFYTVNPANVTVGGLLDYASTYSRHSFNWSKWVAWRNFLGGSELRDYRVVPGLEGFGLSVSFYSDTGFTNLSSSRIDPFINFESSSGAPALNISATAFSARYEGYIKPETSGEYALKLQHSDSGKLWIDDVLLIDEAAEGTHAATADLTAGTFHKIKAEWTNASGAAEFVLKWSADGIAEQVIPQKYFFPKVESKPRYDAHVAFSTPATADFFLSIMMQISGSTRQQVDGLEVFECLEQKESAFTITESDILTKRDTSQTVLDFDWYRLEDVRTEDPFSIFEGRARDIDSRYLTEFEPLPKIVLNADAENPLTKTVSFIIENVLSVNMSRWQMLKLLKYAANREVLKDLVCEMKCAARTYPVIAADIVRFVSESAGVDKSFLVVEAEDDSPQETSDTRSFKLQEWFAPDDWNLELELES